MPAPLDKLINARLNQSAPAGMHALADRLRQLYGDNVLAVIGYGSCLRDGVSPDKISDIYVLVARYADLPDGVMLRAGNRLLPPNVYYLEIPFDGYILRAKYAVLTLDAFEQQVSARTDNPYFWARFAQPCALLHARDDNVSVRLVKAISAAITSLLSKTLPLMPEPFTPRQLWTEALEQTYRTEWRSEGGGRAGEIIAAGAAHYDSVTGPALALIVPDAKADSDGSYGLDKSRMISSAACARQWRRRRMMGKIHATLRLIKAAFTFQGGIDYLLWKVARHSGVQITPSDFQRRHPLLGAPALAWKVYRLGGFR